MTTMIIFHEVKNGDQWAEAWRKGRGSRHEMFAKLGVNARTFRDPKNFDSTGVLLEIPDLAKWQTFMESDEVKKTMSEDGLKIESMRTLVEFNP
jgi:hypothetical protein